MFSLYSCKSKADESGIFIVSEETFNSKAKTSDEASLSFSTNEIKEVEEDHLLIGKRYYALVYLKSTELKLGRLVFGGLGDIELDEDRYVGTSGGTLSSSCVDGMTYKTFEVVNEGKVKKTDVYLAIGFTVNDINTSNMCKLELTFYIYSEYTAGERNEFNGTIEKKLDIRYPKQVTSEASVKYLAEDDYISGDIDGKLKDKIETVAAGEKAYVVIDYRLSGGKEILETDTATVTVYATSDNGESFKISAEDIPTADYDCDGYSLSASFKLSGVDGDGKTLRFIISVITEKSDEITLNLNIYADNISFVGETKLKGNVEFDSSLVSVSRFKYELSEDKTYYILKELGNEIGDVMTVPENYNGLPVKEIASNVFSNSTHVKEIKLNFGLEKIGANAFKGCTELKSIVIPASVSYIGSNAFADCPDIEIYCDIHAKPNGWNNDWTSADTYVTWGYSAAFKLNYDGDAYSFQSGIGVNVAIPETYNGLYVTEILASAFENNAGLKKVKIPNTVKYIGGYAFYNCTSLREITVPDSVETVGKDAFRNCYMLSDVKFGNNSKLTAISEYAFSNCTSLTSFTIPKSVKTIDEYAFNGCEKLVEVINKSSLNITTDKAGSGAVISAALKIHSGVSETVEKDGYIFYDHNGVNYLLGYKGEDSVITLPSSYNGEGYAIYKYAFYMHQSLTKVTVPDSVTEIGENAFYECKSLTDVTLSAESIGKLAFYNCTALKNISLDKSGRLLKIGEYAFYGCKTLSDINIPESVTEIGDAAFKNTGYYSNEENWQNGTLYIGVNLIDVKADVKGMFTVKDGTALIADNAFYGCIRLIAVTLPESLSGIGKNAFSGCHKLVEIINMSSLDIAPDSYGLKALSVHTGESGIIEKDEYLFYTHSGGNYLLLYYGADTELTLPSDFDGENYEIFRYAFYGADNLTSVIIPDSVTAIGEHAFYSCSALTSVTVGSGVTRIGSDAFWACSKLNGVYISDIGKWCVIDFSASAGSNPLFYAKKLYLNGELVTKIVIPNTVTAISARAFYNCEGVTEAIIPDSVKSIGEYAFYGCKLLKNIRYGGSKPDWEALPKGNNWYGVYNVNMSYGYVE